MKEDERHVRAEEWIFGRKVEFICKAEDGKLYTAKNLNVCTKVGGRGVITIVGSSSGYGVECWRLQTLQRISMEFHLGVKEKSNIPASNMHSHTCKYMAPRTPGCPCNTSLRIVRNEQQRYSQEGPE